MTWEELLSSKGFIYFKKCCGGWANYSHTNNLQLIQSMSVVYRPIDEQKCIKIRGNRLKHVVGGRWFTKSLQELEAVLNQMGYG